MNSLPVRRIDRLSLRNGIIQLLAIACPIFGRLSPSERPVVRRKDATYN